MSKELPEYIQQKIAILCADFCLQYNVPGIAVIKFVQDLMAVVFEAMETENGKRK